jgi:hypothetical protein
MGVDPKLRIERIMVLALTGFLKDFRTIALVESQGGMNESFGYVKSGDPNMTVIVRW